MTSLDTSFKGKDLTVDVDFVTRNSVKPVTIVKPEGEGTDTHTIETEKHRITVADARGHQFTIDNHGFDIWPLETKVTDFYNREEVTSIYYPEMERLVKSATGANQVIVFDHTIRVEDPEKRQDMKVRAPVSGMHNDFTIASAATRVRDLLPPDEAEAALKKRYGSMNIWRPIQKTGVVENRPLAICEWNSINENDLVPAERHYPDGRIGGIYYLIHNADQHWYYYPDMHRDEVILLKCYDSLEDGTARWTAHGSFDIPDRPADAAPRESIEIRTLYFFDDE